MSIFIALTINLCEKYEVLMADDIVAMDITWQKQERQLAMSSAVCYICGRFFM